MKKIFSISVIIFIVYLVLSINGFSFGSGDKRTYIGTDTSENTIDTDTSVDKQDLIEEKDIITEEEILDQLDEQQLKTTELDPITIPTTDKTEKNKEEEDSRL